MNLNKLLIENYRKSLLNELSAPPANQDWRRLKDQPTVVNNPLNLPSGSGEDVSGEGDNVMYPAGNPGFPAQIPGGWGPNGNPNAPGSPGLGTWQNPGPNVPVKVWKYSETTGYWELWDLQTGERDSDQPPWGMPEGQRGTNGRVATHPPDGAWYWNQDTGRFERYVRHWWHNIW